jgi:hypothetical protein
MEFTLLSRTVSRERGGGPRAVGDDAQALDRPAGDEVLGDDLVDVRNLQTPVPDAVRVDDQDRTLVVLLIAAHPRRAHPGEFETLDLVPKTLEDVLGSLTTAVMAADRRADEDVQVPRDGVAHCTQSSPT